MPAGSLIGLTSRVCVMVLHGNCLVAARGLVAVGELGVRLIAGLLVCAAVVAVTATAASAGVGLSAAVIGMAFHV